MSEEIYIKHFDNGEIGIIHDGNILYDGKSNDFNFFHLRSLLIDLGFIIIN